MCYFVVTQSAPGEKSLYLTTHDLFGFGYGSPRWETLPLLSQGFTDLATARVMADRMNDRFHAGDPTVPAPVVVCTT